MHMNINTHICSAVSDRNKKNNNTKYGIQTKTKGHSNGQITTA